MRNASLAKTMVCLITLLLVAAFSVVVYADAPPAEVQRAAEEGQAHFLSTIPAEELARLGFATAEDVQAASLGEPYEQFTLTPDAVASYEPGASLASLLTRTDSWLFPVLADGEARTMLTVSMVNGQWQGGDIGGASVAAALQAAEASVPAMLQQEEAKTAYTTQFVRVFQDSADFLFIQAGGAEYLLPLMPEPSFNLEAGTLYTPDQVVPQLTAMGPELEIIEEGAPMGGGAAGTSQTPEQSGPGLLLLGGAAVVVLALVVLGGAFVVLRKSQT